jgi:ribosomal protein S18 acetylase RimI-like enzyme
VISIRDAAAPDLGAIDAVRRVSWRAAYAGLIGQAYLDRATSPAAGLPPSAPWRRTLVAVTGDVPAVVGYASFGPERVVQAVTLTPADARRGLPRFTDAGAAGRTGELYAIYVDPQWWSTGAGRSLMDAAVTRLTAAGYERAVLWVLEGNARARRFYEIAGWKADGADNQLLSLGGVIETRYTRPLALRRARGVAPDRSARPAGDGAAAGGGRVTGSSRAARSPARPRAGAAGPGAPRAAAGRLRSA